MVGYPIQSDGYCSTPLQSLPDSAIPDLPEEDPILRATKATLLQWARAFNHITKRRRVEVLNCMAPRSEYLLDIPDSFNPKEVNKNLFGQSFLTAMMDQAKLDETFRNIEKTPAAPSTSGVQTRQNSAGQKGASRGRGGRGGRGRSSTRGSRYGDSPLFILPSVPCPESVVGGRLKLFSVNWASITDNSWAIRTVSKGLKLDFLELPFQRSYPATIFMSGEMETACDKEIQDLLSKQAVVEILDNQQAL